LTNINNTSSIKQSSSNTDRSYKAFNKTNTYNVNKSPVVNKNITKFSEKDKEQSSPDVKVIKYNYQQNEGSSLRDFIYYKMNKSKTNAKIIPGNNQNGQNNNNNNQSSTHHHARSNSVFNYHKI
jgi:hypothetical protein